MAFRFYPHRWGQNRKAENRSSSFYQVVFLRLYKSLIKIASVNYYFTLAEVLMLCSCLNYFIQLRNAMTKK
jgi:hypothetical protein